MIVNTILVLSAFAAVLVWLTSTCRLGHSRHWQSSRVYRDVDDKVGKMVKLCSRCHGDMGIVLQNDAIQTPLSQVVGGVPTGKVTTEAVQLKAVEKKKKTA